MTRGLSSSSSTIRTSPTDSSAGPPGRYVSSSYDLDEYTDRGTPSPGAVGACFVAASCMIENAATKSDRWLFHLPDDFAVDSRQLTR